MNYCRRIKPGVAQARTYHGDRLKSAPPPDDIIFFEHVPPFGPPHYEEYAFWAVPSDTLARTFTGHLIGESSDMRLERISGQKQLSYKKHNHLI